MSEASSSETGSLIPTRGRSCGSDNGSGVAARSRDHSARVNSMYLENVLRGSDTDVTDVILAHRETVTPVSRVLSRPLDTELALDLEPAGVGRHPTAGDIRDD